MVAFDEIIDAEEKKEETIPTNFNENNAICKTKHFYILPFY